MKKIFTVIARGAVIILAGASFVLRVVVCGIELLFRSGFRRASSGLQGLDEKVE